MDFIKCIPEHDMGTLWNILDVAHHGLIYESTSENLLMQEFMTNLFIAAKASGMLKNNSKIIKEYKEYIEDEYETEFD